MQFRNQSDQTKHSILSSNEDGKDIVRNKEKLWEIERKETANMSNEKPP